MEEILINNKIIGEFMGDFMGLYWSYVNGFYLDNNGQMAMLTNKCGRFHSSLDWLMPVIEKIESLNYLTLKEYSNVVFRRFKHVDIYWVIEGVCDYGDNKLKITNIISNHGKKEIDVLYTTIVEFIKWYNQNK